MVAILVCFSLCADAPKLPEIPADVLAYLIAADAQREERSDSLQKDITRLNAAHNQAKGKLRIEISDRIKVATDAIKLLEKSPAAFHFSVVPQIGSLGCLEEATLVSAIEGTDLVVVQVKNTNLKPVVAKDPQPNDALTYAIVSNPIRNKANAPVLKADTLYRAIRMEQDTPAADAAIAMIQRASQATVPPRKPVLRSLVVLELVEWSIVNVYREQYAKMEKTADPSVQSNAPVPMKPKEIPADVLAYLKAEDAYREELIDVLQREVARLKVVFKQASLRQRPAILTQTKVVLDEIKLLEQSPVVFRFPGIPPLGALGQLEESSIVATIDETDFVLVQVKHNKITSVGPKDPLQDDVLTYALVAGLARNKPGNAPSLKADTLYRASRIEKDTPLAELAISKIPRATQATVSTRRKPVVIRSLVVLEPVDSAIVDVHREQYARVRPR